VVSENNQRRLGPDIGKSGGWIIGTEWISRRDVRRSRQGRSLWVPSTARRWWIRFSWRKRDLAAPMGNNQRQ